MFKKKVHPASPRRGFLVSEYESRLEKTQILMRKNQVDVILLTTKEDIEYYTGFKTPFFQSKTRPWYVLLPLNGKPIAIIPTIGESGMKKTWVDKIETWNSPQPEDEGISLLVKWIHTFTKKYKSLGLALGFESHLRMPILDYMKLVEKLSNLHIKNISNLIQSIRYIKSSAEIEKIKYACQVTSLGFSSLKGFISLRKTEREICMDFKKRLLELGIDDSPYLVSSSGSGGYHSIIMDPSNRKLKKGDIFVLDTGSVYDSYFCDFVRNFAVCSAEPKTQNAYQILILAVEAGFQVARVGNSIGDIYQKMAEVLEKNGSLKSNIGRMGHGLGLQLTEWPSIVSHSNVKLEAGVVLTLEPTIQHLPNKIMVHEENILITEDRPIWLTRKADPKLPIIG